MRIGLIGCGNVVRYCHLPALRRISSVEVVAVADPDPAAFQRAGAGTITAFERYEDLLARDEVEAVLIACPSHLHANIATAALNAGKRIYLEKPVATTLSDAVRVRETMERTSGNLVVGFNRRRHPLFEQARALVRKGVIGRVRAVRSSFCEHADTLPEWKRSRTTGGGVLIDLFSHHVDLLRWFLDTEVRDVRATIGSEASAGDTARVDLTTSGGTGFQGFYSFRAGLSDSLEFIGEDGVLRVDRHSPRLEIKVRRRGYGLRRSFVAPTRDVSRWWMRRLVHPSEDPSYFRALVAFADPLRSSSGSLATIDDGIRSLEAVIAAESSAEQERTIRLGTT
jgi:predicted dehydrogenase